jgi:hypothetical protein
MHRNQFWALTATLGVFFLVGACRKEPLTNVVGEGEVPSCSSKGEFFPPVDLQETISGLNFGIQQEVWESDFLRRMHEPSLFVCNSGNDDATYRLLWDRSLSEPISARLVVHPNGAGTLILRMLAHAGPPVPPRRGQKPISLDEWYKLTLDREVTLNHEQVSRALMLFQRIRFKDESNDKNWLDGSDWIIESKINGKYRLVDFRNGHSQAARAFGTYLVLDLGGIKLPPGAIY